MNQNTWHVCALLWICSSQICLCVFDKFEKCAPIPCGDIPDVSYPFYIQDKQPSYCGQEGFNLSCTRGSLHLSILSNTFLVRQIFYHNRSIRVSDAGFLKIAQTCSPPVSNLSIGGIRFNFTTGREHWVGLYSDCPSQLPPNLTSSAFRVNCSVPGDKAPILAVLGGDPKEGFGANGCKKSVWTRVEVDGGGFSDNKWRGYEEAVRRGLVLNWKATNCSYCRSTGGRCGFEEEDYRFWCYCPDRAHAIACPSPSGRLALH